MTFAGNIFTQYNYKNIDLNWQKLPDGSQDISTKQGLHVKTAATSENTPLPNNSPFSDWRQARRFAGPMPFTFSHDPKIKKMISVEGVRSKWKPAAVEVHEHTVPFFEKFKLSYCTLANAFVIHDVSYLWKKGTIEHCP